MTHLGVGPVWWWLVGAVVVGTFVTVCLFSLEWLLKQIWRHR
jgi:hypothetical protein